MISKSMTAEHDYVVIENERIPYEECIHPVYQTIGEIGDGDRLMLCSNQHNRGTSKSHIF